MTPYDIERLGGIVAELITVDREAVADPSAGEYLTARRLALVARLERFVKSCMPGDGFTDQMYYNKAVGFVSKVVESLR